MLVVHIFNDYVCMGLCKYRISVPFAFRVKRRMLIKYKTCFILPFDSSIDSYFHLYIIARYTKKFALLFMYHMCGMHAVCIVYHMQLHALGWIIFNLFEHISHYHRNMLSLRHRLNIC